MCVCVLKGSQSQWASQRQSSKRIEVPNCRVEDFNVLFQLIHLLLLLLPFRPKSPNVFGASMEHCRFAHVTRFSMDRTRASTAATSTAPTGSTATSTRSSTRKQRLKHVESILDIAATLLFSIYVTDSTMFLHSKKFS